MSDTVDASPMSGSIADRVLERMGPVIAGPPTWMRRLLVAVGVIQLALALPWLVGSDPSGLLGDAYSSHLTRDGSLGVVLGIAALLVAWRPHHALAASIAGGSILVIQLGSGLVDQHFHRVVLWVETTHVPTLVIVALFVAVSRPERLWRAGTRPPPSEVPVSEPVRLRLVPPAAND